MATIPQLRKDINDLQSKLRDSERALHNERVKPPVIKEVVKEVRIPVTKTVEVENTDKINAARDEIRKLKARIKELESKPPVVKTVVKEVEVKSEEKPGPVVYRDKIVYRDNPKHIEMIRRLQRGSTL